MDTTINRTNFNHITKVTNHFAKVVTVIKGLIFFTTALVLMGCSIYHAPTPRDQQEKEFRMQQMLINTSQRNSSDQLKATPEFKRTYDLDRPGVFVPPQTIPEPNDKQRPSAEGDPV